MLFSPCLQTIHRSVRRGSWRCLSLAAVRSGSRCVGVLLDACLRLVPYSFFSSGGSQALPGWLPPPETRVVHLQIHNKFTTFFLCQVTASIQGNRKNIFRTWFLAQKCVGRNDYATGVFRRLSPTMFLLPSMISKWRRLRGLVALPEIGRASLSRCAARLGLPATVR